MKVKYLILDDNTLVDLAGANLETRDYAGFGPKACTVEKAENSLETSEAKPETAIAEAQAETTNPVATVFNNARFFTLYEGAEVAFTLGKKIYSDEYGVARNSNADGYIGVLKIEFSDDFRNVKPRGFKNDADDVRYFAWLGSAFAKGGFENAAAARAMHPEALIIAVGVSDSDVQYVAAA